MTILSTKTFERPREAINNEIKTNKKDSQDISSLIYKCGRNS